MQLDWHNLTPYVITLIGGALLWAGVGAFFHQREVRRITEEAARNAALEENKAHGKSYDDHMQSVFRGMNVVTETQQRNIASLDRRIDTILLQLATALEEVNRLKAELKEVRQENADLIEESHH